MNEIINSRLFCALALILLLSSGRAASQRRPYDPLAVPDQVKGETLDPTVSDQQRKREIPIRVYLPAGKVPAPVVLFSHGLGGSREGSAYLGRHWAARGYVAVFLQHPGSDSAVWQDKPPAQRMAAMRQAADLANFMLRVRDVPGPERSDRADSSERGMGGGFQGMVPHRRWMPLPVR